MKHTSCKLLGQLWWKLQPSWQASRSRDRWWNASDFSLWNLTDKKNIGFLGSKREMIMYFISQGLVRYMLVFLYFEEKYPIYVQYLLKPQHSFDIRNQGSTFMGRLCVTGSSWSTFSPFKINSRWMIIHPHRNFIPHCNVCLGVYSQTEFSSPDQSGQ